MVESQNGVLTVSTTLAVRVIDCAPIGQQRRDPVMFVILGRERRIDPLNVGLGVLYGIRSVVGVMEELARVQGAVVTRFGSVGRHGVTSAIVATVVQVRVAVVVVVVMVRVRRGCG